MTNGFDYAAAQDFGTALLLGALLGIEREKRNMREGFGIAGLRSFVLLAMLGAVGGYMGKDLAMPWLLPAVVVVVGGVVAVGYFAGVRQRPEQVGLTTELAAVAACLIGAMATTGHRDLAVVLGVGMAALLAYKQPLHQLVGQLGWEDVLVGMRLLLATFIVLPLLPDRAIDPWGAINPYKLWLLVLLISGMSLVGYLATRWLGPGRGIAVTAASGGLVSSTAVTLAFAKQSRDEPHRARALAGGVLLAWAVMFVRVVAIAAVVQPALAQALAAPFAAMTVACAAMAVVAMRARDGAVADGLPAVPMTNPFSLLAACKFAALFAVVQLLLKLGQQHLPQSGVYAVAALAGLTDVDAITVSMAERVRAAPADVGIAAAAILVACLSNTAVKTGMAIGLGRGLARTVAVGAAAAAAAGVAARWL